MLSVTVTDIDGTSTTSTFDKSEVVIGRVKGNDIVFPLTNVTKRHARIVKMDGKMILIDMKSNTGTYLNGHRINEPRQLYEGDKFFIGDFALEVHEIGESTPPLDPGFVEVLNAYFNLSDSASPKPAATSPEPCVDVNSRDKNGQTRLHTCERFYKVKRLIEAGADVNARDHLGRTPLHTPNSWNDNIVKLLVAAGADVNAKDNEGQTPLHICEHVAMARALIDAGADINIKDNEGRTPLETCSNDKILEVLVKARANAFLKNKEGNSLLLKCTDYQDRSALKVLIDAGVDVNAKDHEGKTLLHTCKDRSIARILIDAGADVNAKDHEGQTPLYRKIGKPDIEDIAVLKCLIDAGADVNVKDPKGQTPLHSCQVATVAKFFIEAGADIHARDHEGKTPLHTCKAFDVLKALIEAGADVNAKDHAGKTPLHTCQNIYAAFELIKAGADINAKDNAGNLALSIDRIKEMIKLFGKDVIGMSSACLRVIKALHEAVKSWHELEATARATNSDAADVYAAKAASVKAAAAETQADTFLEEATFFGIRSQAYAFFAASAEVSDAAKACYEIITFGHYKQDNDITKGIEPITWFVLDKNEKGQYLIISEKVLDMKPYNMTMVPITWENSTIRSWLNGYDASCNTDCNDYINDNFIDTAFTAEEKARIVACDVSAHDKPSPNTSSDNVTMDKIFLLSIQEANDYFASDGIRWADATIYAIQNGVEVENVRQANGFVHHYGRWWLRSPGITKEFASYVDQYTGSIDATGMGVEFDRIGIRPAMWIQFDK